MRLVIIFDDDDDKARAYLPATVLTGETTS